VFGVEAVLAEHLCVALDDDEVGLDRRVPVGGDSVAGSVGVVQVPPGLVLLLVGVVAVRGDEPESGRVGAGWQAERISLGDEQEVERLDLVGPRLAVVPPPEGAQKEGRTNADSRAASLTPVSGELVAESAVSPPGDFGGGQVGLSQDG